MAERGHDAHEYHKQDEANELPLNDERDLPKAAPKREHVEPNYHKQLKDKSIFSYLVIVLVIVVLGAAIYWLFFAKESTNKSNQSNKSESSSQISSSTKHYDSPNFYLGFDYPNNWTVNDNGGGIMTVASPAMKLKDANGVSVDGQVAMTIRDKSQKLTEFEKGNAVAVRNSEKIAYTKPTQTQRGSTYISFLQYATSPSQGLDGIYITGDNGYQKNQAIPAVDISKSDPVINVVFRKCSDSKCSGKTTQLTIDESSLNNANFSKPILDMLKSLSIT